MSIREYGSKLLASVARTFASGPANRAIRLAGLHSTLDDLYWRLLYLSANGVHDLQVGEASATFHAGTPAEYRHCRTLVYERDVLVDLLERVEPTDVFYDVGSFVGLYACLVADVVEPNRVVAFEPRPEQATRVETNVERNGIEATVRHHALANDEGTADLTEDFSLDLDPADESGDGVRYLPGDALVESGELPAPNVVKVDVEGAEYNVLDGMRETLASGDCRLVYCEVHPTYLQDFDATEAEVHELLTRLGFDVETIHDRGAEHFVRAAK